MNKKRQLFGSLVAFLLTSGCGDRSQRVIDDCSVLQKSSTDEVSVLVSISQENGVDHLNFFKNARCHSMQNILPSDLVNTTVIWMIREKGDQGEKNKLYSAKVRVKTFNIEGIDQFARGGYFIYSLTGFGDHNYGALKSDI